MVKEICIQIWANAKLQKYTTFLHAHPHMNVCKCVYVYIYTYMYICITMIMSLSIYKILWPYRFRQEPIILMSVLHVIQCSTYAQMIRYAGIRE